MADKSVSLQVKVNTDTGQLEVLGAKFQDTAKKADQAQSSFSKLGGEAGSLLKSFIPLATAGGVVAFFTNAVKSAEDFNQTVLRLKGNLAASGIDFAANQKQIMAWSEAIQSATRFDNDVALSSLERFIRVTKDLATAQRASMLAMDLSVRSGKSLEEVQGLLADLLNGNTRSLITLNREFGAFTGGGKDAQVVLDNLQRAVGGAAEAERSLTKDVDQAKAAFGDFSKEIGQSLGPAVAFVVRQGTNLIKVFETAANSIAEFLAQGVAGLQGLASMMVAVVQRRFSDIPKIAHQTAEEMRAINQASADDLAGIWQKGSQEQTDATLRTSQGRITVIHRETEEEKRAREDANQQLLDIENQLAVQMAQLGEKTLQKRLAVIAAEYKAEKDKIEKIKGDETVKAAALAKLRDLQKARVVEETKAEVKIKTQAAYDIAATSIEAIATVNSMGELRTREDARRAKLLLALEKAIAIARLWSAEAGKGMIGLGIAAAGTALIVAQFAAQSHAIDQAQRSSEQGAVNFTASTPLPGGGQLDTTFGGTGTGASGGGGGAPAAAPAAGGGAPVIYILVGGQSLYFNADHVELSEIDPILRRVGDAMRMGTTEGIRAAVSIYNLGLKNAGRAV